MKIQLLFLIAVIWLIPKGAQAYLCYGPGRDYIYSDICRDSAQPATICNEAGYKLHKVTGSYIYCMDKNCLLGKGDTGCQLCASDRMYVRGDACMACPSNAICDGQNIVSCPDGMFINGSQCSACNPSCKTCSGTRNTQCTSCYSGYSLNSGACVKDETEPTKTNTVNSCPSRMTLSSDGCCCINK